MSKFGPYQQGFFDGDRTGQYCRPQDVAHRFPDWDEDQIELYMNARDDAVSGEQHA